MSQFPIAKHRKTIYNFEQMEFENIEFYLYIKIEMAYVCMRCDS